MSSLKLGPIQKLLPKSRFVRGVGVLVGGTAGSQVLMVLALPLLTRLYDPKAFGEFAVYMAILSVLTVIASFRYQLAIPSADNDEDAINLLVLCLFCAAFLASLIGVILYAFGDVIEETLSVSLSTSISTLLVIGVFITGVFQAVSYWAIRKQAYSALALTKIQKSLSSIVIQTGGYFFGSISLIGGHIAGHAFASLSLTKKTLPDRRSVEVSLPKIKKQAWRYRQFPLYSTWGGAFNSAGTELPPILFASLFSPAVAGIYMLAQRVIASPSGMVNQAVGQVFFGNAREARDSGRFEAYTHQLHYHLTMIAAPASVTIFIFSPHLFGVIFGQEWAVAGDYAQCLSIMLYCQFISSPLTNVFNILEQQKKTLAYNLLLVVLRVAGIFFGLWLGSEYLAVMMFSILSAVGYLAFIYGSTSSSGVSPLDILAHHAKALSLACLLLAVPYMLIEVYDLIYLALILAALSCLGYYSFYYIRAR